jgi:hypothetical protein
MTSHLIPLNFLIYEENFILFFISAAAVSFLHLMHRRHSPSFHHSVPSQFVSILHCTHAQCSFAVVRYAHKPLLPCWRSDGSMRNAVSIEVRYAHAPCFPCWRLDGSMHTAPLIEVRCAHAPCLPAGGQICACALLSCWRSDVQMHPASLLEVRCAHAHCFRAGGQMRPVP